jgi:uncharacterized protein (TIGR02597 family)
MKHLKIASLMAVAATMWGLPGLARAAQNSDVVGYTRIIVPANSDVTVSVPYDNAAPLTLNDMFPPVMSNISFAVSSALTTRSVVLEYLENPANTPNRSAVATYYFLRSGSNIGWRKFGVANTVDFGPSNLTANAYVVLRNQNNGTNQLAYIARGGVEQGRLNRTINAGNYTNDIYVATGRPVGMTLNDLQLGGTPAFTNSTALTTRDTILVYDNTASGQNKSAAATYFYLGGATGGWRKFGATGDFGNSNVFDAASGFIIRTAPVGTSRSVEWSAMATFSN